MKYFHLGERLLGEEDGARVGGARHQVSGEGGDDLREKCIQAWLC